jgi:hypothetical protein
MNFTYVFQWGQEIFWAVVIAVAVAVVPLLAGADVDAIFADPKGWLTVLAAAAARSAVAGMILAVQGLLRRLVESRDGE